jgi:hypothetical protein
MSPRTEPQPLPPLRLLNLTNPMEDYNDPAPENSNSLIGNTQLLIALLALAFSVFLFAQISANGQASRSMKWRYDTMDRQLTSTIEAEKRFAELIKQREASVQQAQQVQTRYTEMLNDLLKLAETDNDAKAVVEKYRIQRQDNAQPAADQKPANP